MSEEQVRIYPGGSPTQAAVEAIWGEEAGYCGPGYGTCGSLSLNMEYADSLVRLALAAAVPLVLDEAARRIEAERLADGTTDERYGYGLDDALAVLAALRAEWSPDVTPNPKEKPGA